MFSVIGSGHTSTCAGVSRRDLLRIGSLALGGLSLPGLLASRAQGRSEPAGHQGQVGGAPVPRRWSASDRDL